MRCALRHDLRDLDRPPTFSLRFDEPRDYEYICILHTGMCGTIH
jgi:plastocyanin